MLIPPTSPRAPSGSEPDADVVCIGETMAVLSPPDARPLAHQTELSLAVGGAESNVASALVALGHSAAWLGRVGDDPFGRRILDDLTARGVDVSAVETDPVRPTGVSFKDTGPEGTGTHYYRRDSAATAMDPGLAGLPLLRRARVLHLSGITAALSDNCAELVTRIISRRAVPGPVLVVKDAGHGATAYGADGEESFVPTPAARVVEPVGAGDAFAAGYLAAFLEGRTPASGLRLGHLVAAATLGTREDAPTVLARDTLDRHLALDNAAWSALHLT